MYVRGQERFVTQQLLDHLKRGMYVTLGWDGMMTAGRLPWGAQHSLDWVETTPEVRPSNIKPNLIALSEGPFEMDEELELGPGLVQSSHVFFIDIYAESPSMAKAIAMDVRSLLNGRAGLPEYIPLYDWSKPTAPVLPGHLLSFDHIEVSYPGRETTAQVSWAVVKVTVQHQYGI